MGPLSPSAATHARCLPARDWLGKADAPSAEVVVIGTGAGGAVAGTELAVRGKKVLFLEMGRAFGKKQLQKKKLTWSLRNLFQQQGLQLSRGNMPVLMMSGRGVGGSTLVNSGICFRPPDERLNEWADFVKDERLRPGAMKETVDEIWRRLAVTRTHEGIGRRHNSVFMDGVTRLGWNGEWMDRNAPGCVGCGVCHMGCPSGGKASVDKSFLPLALEHGAEVRTGAKVEHILVEAGRAVGVVLTALDDEDRAVGSVTVRADRVLIAGSALRTPVLLLESGIEGEAVGKHLAIHPASIALADFEEPVNMWDGVPQGAWSHMPGRTDVTLETQSLGGAEIFALYGKPGQPEFIERFKHFTLAGGMCRDDGNGSVAASNGQPAISYDFSAADLEKLKAGIIGAVRVYFAGGAKRVSPLVHPLRFYDDEDAAVAAVEAVTEITQLAHIHASHPHGSCRMGPDASVAACDKDGKVFGVDGLYVVDGSLFPNTLGVNPQVTIMSLALALSRRMTA